MKLKNLLVVVMVWQFTSGQENCPDLKLSTGLGTLLGNLPITNCAPDLPSLPDLSYGDWGDAPYLPSLPHGGCLPSLPSGDCIPSLPLGDCIPSPPLGDCIPSLPLGDCIPSLPLGDCIPSLPLGDCIPSLPPLPPLDCGYDYPGFAEPLPYLKKKCLCSKPLPCFKYPKPFKPCGLRKPCGLLKKYDCLDECGDLGVALKIKPLITALPIKSKKILPEAGAFESLPCELPSLVSDVFRGSLAGGCF